MKKSGFIFTGLLILCSFYFLFSDSEYLPEKSLCTCFEDMWIKDLIGPNINYHNFSHNIWNVKDTICFKEYIDDSTHNYFITIALQNTLSYEYQNIIFFVHHYFNNNLTKTDTIDMRLANNDGMWIGKNIEGTSRKESVYVYNNDYIYGQGEHLFKLELAMRDNTKFQLEELGNISCISLLLNEAENRVPLIARLQGTNAKEDEYYIPKPRAKIKIALPSSKTTIFEDDIMTFTVSNSAVVESNNNIYRIQYSLYNSEIVFLIKDIIDLDLDIYNFENEIIIHENQGAYITADIIEDPEDKIYGVLCGIEGNKIAVSSQFFITDSTNYFLSGSLGFNTSINPEIEVQNNIMKQEVLKFIHSFKWSSIPK